MEFDKSDVRKLMYFLYMEGNKATNIANRINKIVGGEQQQQDLVNDGLKSLRMDNFLAKTKSDLAVPLFKLMTKSLNVCLAIDMVQQQQLANK